MFPVLQGLLLCTRFAPCRSCFKNATRITSKSRTATLHKRTSPHWKGFPKSIQVHNCAVKKLYLTAALNCIKKWPADNTSSLVSMQPQKMTAYDNCTIPERNQVRIEAVITAFWCPHNAPLCSPSRQQKSDLHSSPRNSAQLLRVARRHLKSQSYAERTPGRGAIQAQSALQTIQLTPPPRTNFFSEIWVLTRRVELT